MAFAVFKRYFVQSGANLLKLCIYSVLKVLKHVVKACKRLFTVVTGYKHALSVFYILMGMLFVPNGLLRGAGDMGAFTLSSMANLFSRVAIAYILAYLTPLGANSIWWSIPAGWAVGASVSLLRVRSGRWMRRSVADLIN